MNDEVAESSTVRSASRSAEAPDDDPELESLATARAHSQAQQSGVARLAETMDLGPALEHALSSIPEHFRGAIVLVDVEEQTFEEAARVLGIAVGTVLSRLFRGRRLLQDLLLEYARDAGFAATRKAASSSAPSAKLSQSPQRDVK